jgi:hypothetical protein
MARLGYRSYLQDRPLAQSQELGAVALLSVHGGFAIHLARARDVGLGLEFNCVHSRGQMYNS